MALPIAIGMNSVCDLPRRQAGYDSEGESRKIRPRGATE